MANGIYVSINFDSDVVPTVVPRPDMGTAEQYVIDVEDLRSLDLWLPTEEVARDEGWTQPWWEHVRVEVGPEPVTLTVRVRIHGEREEQVVVLRPSLSGGLVAEVHVQPELT